MTHQQTAGTTVVAGNAQAAPLRSADLVRAFTGGPAGTSHPVLDAAARLAAHHRGQWAAEDRCRDHAADDAVVAETKRYIDQLNSTRIEEVDRLDAWADAHLVAPADAALHTETYGHLVDRLAVAWVRSRAFAERAGQDESGRPDARRALTLLAQMCDAYDDLMRDIREGRRRLPSWRSLKRYGSAR